MLEIVRLIVFASPVHCHLLLLLLLLLGVLLHGKILRERLDEGFLLLLVLSSKSCLLSVNSLRQLRD